MSRRDLVPLDEVPQHEITQRLAWLLRLRWLVLPVLGAVDLANALLHHRAAPWSALAAVGVLVLANGVYALLLKRPHDVRTLVWWARVEAALVIALPVVLVALHGDPANPIRYVVLVGVVGAAILPWAVDVAMVASWGFASLVVADALALGFDPARLDGGIVARWAMEAGLMLTVAAVASYLQDLRDGSAGRMRETIASLERGKAEWDAALEAVAELVVVTDPAGRVHRVNRAFANLVGAKRHEVTGRALAEVLAGHPDAWWANAGDGVVEVEDPVFDTIYELRTRRLGDRIVRVARDVGEGRRLEARLVQADKLAAVGVLASGAAHEIGSPITFVTANLTELKRYVGAYEMALADLADVAVQGGLAEKARARLAAGDVALARRESSAAIAESLRGIDRINRIVTDLRSIARRDPAGEPAAPVELGEVVQAVFRTAAGELRSAHAKLSLAAPGWVNGRRGELVDVVLNLVVNAIQARDDGRPNHIDVSVRRENGHVVLRVADTGKGITPGHLKRLFEPFFTTKAPGEGTGLGLSLARKIVVAHGGSIDVSSELGVGSTFTVKLPACDEPALAATA